MILSADVVEVNLTGQSRALAIILAVAFVAMILELVRRHRLQERYTAIWLAAGVMMLVGAIAPDATLGSLARVLGVRDTNAALFSILILVLLALALHLTVVVSRQSEQITRLAQRAAIEEAERELALREGGGPERHDIAG